MINLMFLETVEILLLYDGFMLYISRSVQFLGRERSAVVLSDSPKTRQEKENRKLTIKLRQTFDNLFLYDKQLKKTFYRPSNNCHYLLTEYLKKSTTLL